MGFVTDFNRLNHRMHNKLMVMDNAVAIVGGRNMSDPYFEVHPEFNYRDLDIAAAGPVVRDLSNVFDRFWNGEWSVPISALVDRTYTDEDLRAPQCTAHGRHVRYPHPLNRGHRRKLKSELATFRTLHMGHGAGGLRRSCLDRRPGRARDSARRCSGDSSAWRRSY